MTKLRRNDVVVPRQGGLYGRVSHVLPDDHYRVVDCGKHITIYHRDDIVPTNYRGYEDHRRFVPMTPLRKLKQRAGRYNRDNWKKRSYKRFEAYDLSHDLANSVFWACWDNGREITWTNPRAVRSPNIYRMMQYGDIVAVMHRTYRPNIIQGSTWKIMVITSPSYPWVKILHGKLSDILHDCTLIYLQHGDA